MLYLTEGDYINAGLSALSIIPGADAFTKTGKASKVLGNGIVESGLKHLDNVADGIKNGWILLIIIRMQQQKIYISLQEK